MTQLNGRGHVDIWGRSTQGGDRWQRQRGNASVWERPFHDINSIDLNIWERPVQPSAILERQIQERDRTGRDVWGGLVNMWERRVDDVDIRERQGQDMFEIPTQVGKMISKGTMEIFEMQQNRPELRMSAIIEGLVGERTDPSCT